MGLYPLGTGKSIDRALEDLAVPEFNHLEFDIDTLGAWALPEGYQPIPIHRDDPIDFMHMKLNTPEGKLLRSQNEKNPLFEEVMNTFEKSIQTLKQKLGDAWQADQSDLENVYQFMDAYTSDLYNGRPVPDFVQKDPELYRDLTFLGEIDFFLEFYQT